MNMKLKRKLNRAFNVATMSLGLLIGGAGLAWAATVIGTSITLDNGAGLQTSTSNGNTAVLRAYDVDGTAYTTFATLTAGNTPTMDLNADVTIGGVSMYRVGGTDVAVADGGTGASTTADARTNLGLVIGTNVQAWADNLDSWSAIAPASMATLTGVETLTNKRVNGLNFVTEDDGFTIAGGTIWRTFTVSGGQLYLQLIGGEPITTLMVPSSGQLVTRDSVDLLTNKTYNGLTPTSNLDGFSLAGGTTSRSLTLIGQDVTLTATGAANVTLPASGTLATLAGAEALTNKTVNGFSFIPNFDGFTINAGSIARSLTVAGQDVTLTATGATNVTLPTTGTLTTLNGAEELTNKMINGVNIFEGEDAFTISGGTTNASTLIVGGPFAFGSIRLVKESTEDSTLIVPSSGYATIVTNNSTIGLTNKTINVDSNTVTNINGNELDPIAGNNYGVPIIWKATITEDTNVTITESAPFKFKVLDVWIVSTSDDSGGGDWHIWNNTSGEAVAERREADEAGQGKVFRAGFIYAGNDVEQGDDIELIGAGEFFDGEVYVMLMRVD
ncbi:hypothetical protein KKF05_00350 [Patescibacteria group bacterium]|nr:hypothetical protein [Patescibacteria group bacterium]